MNHSEPGAGRFDESAGAPGGQAVWESELPWELPPSDDAPPQDRLAAEAAFTAPVRADAPAVPEEATAHLPAVTEAPAAGQPPRAAERRPRDGRRPRTERPAVRGHLAKPLLAGAGVLSALFLLAPQVFNDDAPSQTVQAGAEDTEPDFAPASGSPRDATGAPDRAAPDEPRDGRAGATGHDRIAEVAATASAEPGRPLAAMTEPRATPDASTGTRSATPRATPEPSATPQEHWTSTAVDGTSVLEPGQSWSTNRIVLAFQGDGNLVLYDRQGTPLWWSGTAGQGGVKAVFQADGNLAVYAGDARTVWSSRTDGHDGSRLVLRADGNMVIEYGGSVLWSTGTAM